MKSAWIRLRHLTPIVGTKTVVDSSSASSYLYQYHVPSSPADVEKWASETIVWSKEKKTVLERDDGLKVHWWTPADMHYDYELHVGPDVQDGVWHFLRVPFDPSQTLEHLLTRGCTTGSSRVIIVWTPGA